MCCLWLNKTPGQNQGPRERCKKRQQYIRDRKQASKAVQMKPQPPRDLRVGKITATTIELKWAPPILDGGATVFEYEVVFSVTLMARVGKKVNKTASALPSLANDVLHVPRAGL